MRITCRYQTTQNVGILHEFTSLSFSTSNSFPQRVISSDASHHQNISAFWLSLVKILFPGSDGGRVNNKSHLSGDVGSMTISLPLKRILFAYNVFSRLFPFSSWKAAYLHVPWFQMCGP